MRHCHLSVSSLSMISLNSLNIFIMVVWKPLLKLTSDPSHRQFLLSASLLIYRSQFCFFQYVSFWCSYVFLLKAKKKILIFLTLFLNEGFYSIILIVITDKPEFISAILFHTL